MEEFVTPTKIDTQYIENRICFSLRDCSLDKKYSFYTLTREQAKRFINRLKHIEKMTWKGFAHLPRETGLTPERSDSESWNMIHGQNTYEIKDARQYYFHFRVEQTGKFRVFGYQRRQFFCITHIDHKGRIHH